MDSLLRRNASLRILLVAVALCSVSIAHALPLRALRPAVGSRLVPTITSLSPSSAIAGGSAFQLVVKGTDLGGKAVVKWNGVVLNSVPGSIGSLTVSVPAADIALAGQANVTVSTSSGLSKPLVSKPFVFSINNPVPVLTSVTPASFYVGQADATLTLKGTGFFSGSKVYWNSTALTTTYVSSTSLTAVAPDTLFAGTSPITAVVSVSNAAPGGGSSATMQVSDSFGTPRIDQSYLPFSAGAADTSVQLWIHGVGRGPLPADTLTVDWNGALLTASYAGSIEFLDGSFGSVVSVTVPAADLLNEGTAQVTVSDSGGTSSAIPAYIVGSYLSLTSAGPVAVLGGPAYTLTLTGTGLSPGVEILWNGVARTPTYMGPGKVQIQVAAADVAVAGTVSLQAINTKDTIVGHTIVSTHTYSNTLTYPILANPVTVYTNPGTTTTTLDQPSNQIVSDMTHGVLYVSTGVPVSWLTSPNCGSLLVIDPATGTITATLGTGYMPYTLAISDDDSQLYVAYPSAISCNSTGASLVSRFSLPGPVGENLNWEADYNSTADGPYVMAVEPGAPKSVAIMWVAPSNQTAAVAVFDDATPRTASTTVSAVGSGLGEGYMAWGPAGTLYLGDAAVGSGTLHVMGVDSSGLTQTGSFTGALPAFSSEVGLHYDATSALLFTDTGSVLDPSTGKTVTQLFMPDTTVFSEPEQLLLDSANRKAYMCYVVYDPVSFALIGTDIVSYDMDSFAPLGIYSIPMSSTSPRPTLVRWGVNGLALRDGGLHIYLVQGDFVH